MFDIIEHYKEPLYMACEPHCMPYTPSSFLQPLRGELNYSNFIKKATNFFIEQNTNMFDDDFMIGYLDTIVKKRISDHLFQNFGFDTLINSFNGHTGDDIVRDIWNTLRDNPEMYRNYCKPKLTLDDNGVGDDNGVVTEEKPVIENKPVVKEPIVIKPKKKFKIGERYYIYPMKNKKLKREYEVKKTIYKIKDKEVNILIMKQTSGSETTKFTLNKHDCLKFHLKYEDGLEVFSMDLNWNKVK